MFTGQPYPRRAFALTIVAGIVLVTWACGGTSVTELAGPDAVRCQVTLASDTSTIGPDGGAARVNVDAARDCTWTASTDASWVTLSSASGQGAAAIGVTIAASQQPAVRTAAVVVNNQRVAITQEARPCRFVLSSSRGDIGASGGPLTVAVTTLDACSWRATTSAPWIEVRADTRTGSGEVDLTIAANAGPARDGTVTIAGELFTVTQSAAANAPQGPSTCTAVLQPATLDASAAPSTETVRIETGGACDWTAASNAPWLTIASGISGRGPGTVQIAIAQNSGAARTGTVTIGGQLLTVRQAESATPQPCTYAIEPPSRAFESAGGEGIVQVTAPAGCEWSAASTVTWITVTTARGTGSGQARYTVLPNAGSSGRSATLTIAGRAHTVTQSAPAPACTFTLDPSSLAIGASGGQGQFRVLTQAGCAWSASGGAAWLTLTTAAGTGSGDVVYTVQANTASESRTATITVGGQAHTVTQAAAIACTFNLAPQARTIAASGGQAMFRVVTQTGCAWSATSDAPWVIVTNTSGTGAADITYTVQANPAPEPRAATISVGGQSHRITQEAAALVCTFSLSPTTVSMAAAGGDSRFSVTTQTGCAWTASGGAAWLTIAAGSGTGSGDVTYTVQANSGTAARSATISVGGQAHTVTQAGAAPLCTYALDPSSMSVGAAGGEARFGVVTQAGCAWVASSAAAWLSIASGSGSGPGEVVYTIQANSATDPRSASIVVGGQSHVVTQGGATSTVP